LALNSPNFVRQGANIASKLSVSVKIAVTVIKNNHLHRR
jgi:hypothetical protein